MTFCKQSIYWLSEYFLGTIMNCPKCNADNPIDVVFCVSCGEPLTPQVGSGTSRKMRKNLILGLIIVVVVLVIIAALVLAY